MVAFGVKKDWINWLLLAPRTEGEPLWIRRSSLSMAGELPPSPFVDLDCGERAE